MDDHELLGELRDRHADHLVYEGPYRLGAAAPPDAVDAVLSLFDDWRQRIYRFDNRFGASVILYQPVGRTRMRWDLVVARFLGQDPFDFRYTDGVAQDLRWRDIQGFLDRIKSR
jgi:hypothetical protein